MLTRRICLSAAMTVAAALLAGCQGMQRPAVAQPIGAVRIDVSRLAELGVGRWTATVKTRLERDLAGLVAPGGQRGGATLTVAVRALTLPTYVGGDAEDGPGSDALESIVTVSGGNGQVLASWPLLSSNGSGDAGSWTDQDLIEKRVNLLATNHAIWIRRYLAG